jgi:hypothetical protein
MKKLMFLTVLLNLMIALPSTVLAQAQLRFDIGSGAGTPAVGQELMFDLHARRNNEPNAPSGTKYLFIKFSQNNKALFAGLKQLTAAEVKNLSGLEGDGVVKYTITKVENPLPARAYDGLNFFFLKNNLNAQESIQIEVLQSGKKNLGKMKIYLKKV